VAVSRSHTGGAAGDEIRITPIASEPLKSAREGHSIALCDTACPLDVLPSEIGLPRTGRFSGEFVQSLDPLFGDAHSRSVTMKIQRRSVTRLIENRVPKAV